ncbi:MAG: YwaF family protein [Lachnospiraceae bacterium]|nr:YwaF family protein [Lachnospiraceae bacterium]
MEIFTRLIIALQYEIERPKSWHSFHLFWIGLCILTTYALIRYKPKDRERYLKTILGVYGIIALVLEISKQIIWSYDGTWHYQWYSAPFQLCTTPVFASLIALFLRKGKFRDHLLSYMAFVTILGSFATAVYPETCFVRTLLVDVHTMFLHMGSLAVSLYLLAKEVDISWKSFRGAYCVFLMFAFIAEMLNVIVYNTGTLNGQTFNMFYISPYFISPLPVLNAIQRAVPFPVFLMSYLYAVFLGSGLVLIIASRVKLIASGKNLQHNKRKLPQH